MTLFFAIIGFVLGSEILFWTWAHRQLAPTRRRKLWRTLLHTYMTLQTAGFISIFLQRAFHVIANFPATVLAVIYLWHLLILPATAVSLAIGYSVAFIRRRTRFSPIPQSAIPNPQSPTRRQMLLATATAIPPLLTGVSAATALMQLGNFRVRNIDIPLADLPADLDGMTIAHVSDTHVGRFTYGQKLNNIAEVTNSLRADLVLFTGDLIDYSLSDLPPALDMLKRMDPRHGLYLCEGNHDLFQSRAAFDDRVRAAGFELLSNESRHALIRGRRVQVLGVRWGMHGEGPDAAVHEFISRLATIRDPEAFPILLAHHPHALDAAAAWNFPLTLSGHTHGGQLMLTDNLGPGPLFYRYWSGLYRQGNAAAVISNGVGNWFPLHTHAPAEIIKITLRHVT